MNKLNQFNRVLHSHKDNFYEDVKNYTDLITNTIGKL